MRLSRPENAAVPADHSPAPDAMTGTRRRNLAEVPIRPTEIASCSSCRTRRALGKLPSSTDPRSGGTDHRGAPHEPPPANSGTPRLTCRLSRAAQLGPAARPGLLPDASRTLAGRPDAGPYRQVGQPPARVGVADPKIDSFTASAAWGARQVRRDLAAAATPFARSIVDHLAPQRSTDQVRRTESAVDSRHRQTASR